MMHDRLLVPPQLSNYFRTKKYGNPQAGGWLDQPHKMMTELDIAGSTYEMFSSYKRSVNKMEWSKLNKDAFKTIMAYITKEMT